VDMAKAAPIPTAEQKALTIPQFAAQFGKKRGWGYHWVSTGRVKTIKGFGNILIPRSEVDRIINEGGAE